ncbi:MAG: MFS transporter, partial [Planctomycetota bacterium]
MNNVPASAPATTASGSNDFGEPRAASLFSYRGFNMLFLGSLFGKLADRLYQMAMVAAAFVVFVGSSSENQLAYIQIVATVPLVFAYTLTGALVDAVDRRRLMYGLMAVKCVLVFGLLPLLWAIQQDANSEQIQWVRDHWKYALGLVFLLSLVDAPFGPARAAAVPDVAPREHYRLGASLMATSGLISLLLGTLIGSFLAQTRYLGPAQTILIAAGCYAFSSLLLLLLPNAVAVPGRLREKSGDLAKIPQMTLREYLIELRDGFRYCGKTRGVFELIFFETAFWCLGSAFYLLFAWHMDFHLHLRADNKTQCLGLALGAAGVGLFIGAISAGKLSRKVSPIVTYPLAFLIMGLGTLMIFQFSNVIEQSPGQTAQFKHGDWVVATLANGAKIENARIDLEKVAPPGMVNARLPEQTELTPILKANVTLLVGTLTTTWLLFVCGAGFIVGLGGGLLLGRVDADVLSIVDERMRGRVFSVKAIAFTAALLGTMGPLTISGDMMKANLVTWFGLGIMIAFLPALLLSWNVDIAIWARKGDTEAPGAIHRLGYAATRCACWLLLKILFRYKVHGAEKIPASGPCVLIANHASFMDPIFLGCATRRITRYTMYASYYQSWAHPIFRFLRCIAVDEKSTLAALKANTRALEEGACIGIFPEGRITDDGRLQSPQHGALFLAQRSGAQVTPVAIKGNYQAFPRQAKLPRCSQVQVFVLEPFVV